MRRVSFLFLALFGALSLHSAPALRDLGEGLSYARIRDLDKDTLAASGLPSAVVLDLRGATSSQPEGIARLRALIDVSARGQLRLVLVDSETSADALAALEHRGRSVLTLAAETSGTKPDIAVVTSAEADRSARKALDDGKPFKDVLAAKLEKRRYDEAAMVRDHNNGVPIPDGPPDPVEDPSAPTSREKSPAPKPPPPPFDAVLQRAIHVFQSLAALKKL